MASVYKVDHHKLSNSHTPFSFHHRQYFSWAVLQRTLIFKRKFSLILQEFHTIDLDHVHVPHQNSSRFSLPTSRFFSFLFLHKYTHPHTYIHTKPAKLC